MAISISLSYEADNAGLTTATFKYECTGASLPENSDYDSDDDEKVTYEDLTYEWTFTPGGKTVTEESSGTKYVENLTQGAANTISANLLITCTKRFWYREWDEEEEEWSLWKEDRNEKIDDYIVGKKEGYSTTITIYTKPGDFKDFDGQVDQLINDVINATSAGKWNAHCSAYLSWKNKTAKTVNIAFPSGQLITADWFNSLRTACGSPESVPVAVKDQTLISADIFQKLGAAISKS